VFLSAQETQTPRVEVFGGYAFARIDDTQGPTQRHIDQNGWNASVAVNITKYLGVVSDFGGYYGTHRLPTITQIVCLPCPPPTPNPFGAATKFHTYMFGPQASFRFQSVTPFVHGLFGGAHESGKIVPTLPFGSSSNSGFAYALGGGMDITFSRHFAYRGQADYMRFSVIKFQPKENNVRFSTGVVLRFGGESR
jgi:hypothetical protein